MSGYYRLTTNVDAAGEINDQLNARVVSLRIFAVNGIAPRTLADENGDGVVDARDATLAGFELLSRETVVRFRQFYDALGFCGNDLVADFRFFDFDGSGLAHPAFISCPSGPGGIIPPP